MNWNARAVENPTIEQIKNEIDNGHPVIMPTDGRMLDNRYYTSTEYHVFVVSGYDDDKKMFIVQDGGTYRGHDYQYAYSIVMNAMHDYNSTDVSLGRRVAIFTSPGKKEPDKSEAAASPVLSVAPSSTPAVIGENKNNISPVISPAVSQKSIEGSGLVKMIEDFWTNFIERIKKIFRIF